MDQPLLAQTEDKKVSCKILLQLIEDEKKDEIKGMILADLYWKSHGLLENDMLKSRLIALMQFVPPHIKKYIEKYHGGETEMSNTEKVDVLIILPIEEEMKVIRHVFNVNDQKARIKDSFRFYKTTLKNVQNKKLDVVLTMLGKAGQVTASSLCSTIFNYYKPKLAILCGVCAGLKNEVYKGDVLLNSNVLDCRPGVATSNEKKPRPNQYQSSAQIERDIQNFNYNPDDFCNEIKKHIDILNKNRIQIEDSNKELVPNIHKNCIITPSDEVARDGRLPGMRKKFHDSIRALDMECAGFAEACKQHNITWLITRGVMDYGNGRKNDTMKIYAALVASIVTHQFIVDGYCKPEIEF